MAGQGDLVGDAAADRAWVGQDRLLLRGDLGSGEPDHQGGLGGCGCGLDALEQRDLVDPRLVVRGVVPDRAVGDDGRRVGQVAQPGQQGSQLPGHHMAGGLPGGSVDGGRAIAGT